MLKENIKSMRKSKGLSQEELAIKLNVVRQTISKWEQGLSVPDAEMLIKLAEVFDTTVTTLLGENISESKVDDLKAISEKLEIINLQLSQRKNERRKIFLFLSRQEQTRRKWWLLSLYLVAQKFDNRNLFGLEYNIKFEKYIDYYTKI